MSALERETEERKRPGDAIEVEAVERARRAVEAADLVLLVIDGSKRLSAHARALWEQITGRPRAAVLTVINKSDLGCRIAAGTAERLARSGPVVRVSALTGDGLDGLRAAMAGAVRSDAVDRSTHGFWLNARHRAALLRASESLANARAALDTELGLEFPAADLHAALAALGDLVGATTHDDILDAIFARFCIGK